MSNLPHIDKMKFGIIDQDYMNTLAESSGAFDEMKPTLSKLVTQYSRKSAETFFAIITSYESIATATAGSRDVDIAWKYNWSKVELANLPQSITSDNLTSQVNYEGSGHTSEKFREMDASPYTGYAYNLAELSNIMTSPIVFGVDVSSDNYPEGYSPQPCPIDSVVQLTEMLDFTGKQHFKFDRQGVHDGDCETV